MNDNDRDLILDLAGSRLTGDEAAAAEARVAADPELRHELEAQRSAMAAIQTAAAVEMTVDERAYLHASLIEQLHLAPQAVQAAQETRTNRWLAPLAGLAAVAAVFIGALVVLPNMSGDDAASSAGAEIAAADTTAADTTKDTSPSLAFGDAADQESREAAGEASGNDLAEESATTTAAASAPAVGSELLVPMLAASDVDELHSATQQRSLDAYATSATVIVDEALVFDCIAALSDLADTTDHEILGVAENSDGGFVTIIGYVDIATGEPHVASLDVAACAMIDASS